MRLQLPPYATINGKPRPPHPAQIAFHSLEARFRFFRGGLGSGKSLAGSRQFIYSILRNHKYLVDSGQRPGALYLAAAPTYDLVEAGAWDHVEKWCDEAEAINGFSLIAKRRVTPPRRMTLVTGDVIKFVSLDRPRMFAGANAAGVWYDESELAPDPISGWQALINRLRDNRFPDQFLFGNATSTPRGNRGLSAHFDEEIAGEDADYGMVKARTSDNPGVSAGYVRNIAKTMSAREELQQLGGELVSDEGAVYGHEYSPSESIIGKYCWSGPTKGRSYRVAIDWGGHYHALIIEHDDRMRGSDRRCPLGGRDLVVGEVVMDNCQDAEFLSAVCQRLEEMRIDRYADNFFAYCDYNPIDTVRMATQKRYFAERLAYRRVSSTQQKEAGIRTVQWRLRSSEGERRLHFSGELRNTASNRGILKSMLNYSRKELVIDGQKVLLGVNQDSPYSHGPDALRYFCWQAYQRYRPHDNPEMDARAAA